MLRFFRSKRRVDPRLIEIEQQLEKLQKLMVNNHRAYTSAVTHSQNKRNKAMKLINNLSGPNANIHINRIINKIQSLNNQENKLHETYRKRILNRQRQISHLQSLLRK